MKLKTKQLDREVLLLIETYHTVENSGWGERSMPIIHLCGRNTNMKRRHIRIFGFRPRFYVSEQEFIQKRDLIERQMSKRSGAIIDYGMGHKLMSGIDPIDGVMIVCEVPDDVKGSRESTQSDSSTNLLNDSNSKSFKGGGIVDRFERTWEADVGYCDVFKHEKGIQQYLSVPTGVNEVHHSKVRSEDNSGVTIDERVCTFDIEVRSDEGFPQFDSPEQPITAITAHDSVTDEYWSGILRSSGWGSDVEERLRGDTEVNQLTFYNTDKELCYDFVQYLREIQPDLLCGWNSEGFDIPYFINRCLTLNVGGLEKLSPTNDVGWIHDARAVEYKLRGLLSLDVLKGYKAVTIGQEPSYSLDAIAEAVLGRGKEDVDGGEIDDVWKEEPELFLKYSVRDVEAVVEIMKKKDILTDFRGRRELTGTQISSVNFPKNLIDSAVLEHSQGYLQQ